VYQGTVAKSVMGWWQVLAGLPHILSY